MPAHERRKHPVQQPHRHDSARIDTAAPEQPPQVDDGHGGDGSGHDQRRIEQPWRGEDRQCTGDGGLDHHRAGNVGQRQPLFALAHPDQRMQRYRLTSKHLKVAVESQHKGQEKYRLFALIWRAAQT